MDSRPTVDLTFSSQVKPDDARTFRQLLGLPMADPFAEYAFPCRVMPTRHCPVVFAGVCGTRPCARFDSDDESPWLADIRHRCVAPHRPGCECLGCRA